jgi:hypothetical protein
MDVCAKASTGPLKRVSFTTTRASLLSTFATSADSGECSGHSINQSIINSWTNEKKKNSPLDIIRAMVVCVEIVDGSFARRRNARLYNTSKRCVPLDLMEGSIWTNSSKALPAVQSTGVAARNGVSAGS